MTQFHNAINDIHGLMQERRHSIANALGLHLSCINSSTLSKAIMTQFDNA